MMRSVCRHQQRVAKGCRVRILLRHDEAQAEVVRRIFNTYAAGFGTRAVAATLNAENIPSPGSFWKKPQDAPRGKMDGKCGSQHFAESALCRHRPLESQHAA